MYALITGASSGIGKELAALLAQDGYDLILVARNESALRDVEKQLLKLNVDIVIKTADLSEQKNCYALFNEVKDYDISLFFNNAGYGNLGHFTDTDLNLELNMLNLNIVAVQILTKLYLKQYQEGTVINISSMASFLPTPTFATYAATKAYVKNFSLAVNHELKKQGKKQRVITVVPGPVKTAFNQRAKASINRGMDVQKCAKLIYRDVKKNKSLIIPGFLMKLTYFLMKLIPVGILLKASYRIQTKK